MLSNLRLFGKFLPLKHGQTQVNRTIQRNFTQRINSLRAKESAVKDEPIQFFGSQAASWRAKDTRSGGVDDSLWYQPYVILGSLAVFLVYFCILREESDIDRKLEGNLFDHVAGLEGIQLTVNYKYNKENGLDTKDIEKRLSELGINVKQLETNTSLVE